VPPTGNPKAGPEKPAKFSRAAINRNGGQELEFEVVSFEKPIDDSKRFWRYE
jgi:hypothetical protein